MADKLDATFFAFRKRERGGVLTAASVAFLVGALVLYCIFGAISWLTLGINPLEMQQFAMQAETNPEALQSMASPGNMALMGLSYLVFLFVIFILLAAYEAACLRWMIRGETKGLFGLALDADTWRIYGIYWVWLIFFVIGSVALVILSAVLGASIGAAAGAQSPILWIVPLIFFIVPIYFSTRLAPASATAVAERKFAFFDAWKVSSGRFWALFGAYLLLWIIYLVLVIGVTIGWLSFMLGGRMSEIFSSSDPTAASLAFNQAVLESMGTPTGLATYIGISIITYAVAVIFYVALFGVNARAALAALEEGKIEAERAS